MDEENKLPLKRVELSLSKFNEVAIPHHLDLLRQHKANIIKHSAAGEWRRVRSEQSGAARAAARLRALLGELGALRRSVRAADRAAFDALTRRARADTLQAVADYHDSVPLPVPGAGDVEGAGAGGGGSVTSTESVGVVRDEVEGVARDEEGDDAPLGALRLQVDLAPEEAALAERAAALRGWAELQAELGALHDAWLAVHAAARAQRDPAAHAAAAVHAAADHVAAARGLLAGAERLRGAAALGAGAALGALVGGPLGLVVGAKAGAAAALAGSLLGYGAARALGRRAAPPAPPAPPDDKDKDA